MSNTLITKKGRNQKHDIIEEIHGYNICIDTREIFCMGVRRRKFRCRCRIVWLIVLKEFTTSGRRLAITQLSSSTYDGGDWYSV